MSDGIYNRYTGYHNRQSIRLKNFDYNTDGAYFVTICTFQKSKIINDAYQLILKKELLGLNKRFKGIKVDYYVFMPNHFHIIFIFHNSQVGLSRVIQAFKSMTTLKLKKAGFRGTYFWQKNYYEHVVRNVTSLNRIREYIKQNPEKESYDFK